MDAIVDTLKNRELPDVKVRLDEISEDLHREGLYFATYKDMETLLIVSNDIVTTSFDLIKNMNNEVLVTKTDKDLKFTLGSNKEHIQGHESKSYFSSESSNFIKALQTPENITLDTNFPSKLFNIKVRGKLMPAIIFSKDDLK
ncbi:hypothetical protein F0919_15595 [Taibaiella lutea]|uniref:Uncharacterized protein n=1 Tax=Taibaiella lutea TaxID=2608001 RepID=A0A5M6CB39_9BACT|nr:hypothetical protein [Taibaiella lutea]KAA5532221.1 hypothetical protein F0919_15595 [Taibaiella lutea]